MTMAQDQQAIMQELARVLDSQAFQNCRRLRDFLTYSVEHTLNGTPQDLTGYSIGVAVFGRNPDHDAQSDTLVRVTAGKLRQKLASYYAGEGQASSLRLSLPLGGYRVALSPALSRTTTTNSPGSPLHIGLEPIAALSREQEHAIFAEGLSSEVCLALLNLEQFVLHSTEGAEDAERYGDLPTLNPKAAPDYRLRINLRWSEAQVFLTSQLVESSCSRILWMEAQDFHYQEAATVPLQRAMATHLSRRLSALWDEEVLHLSEQALDTGLNGQLSE